MLIQKCCRKLPSYNITLGLDFLDTAFRHLCIRCVLKLLGFATSAVIVWSCLFSVFFYLSIIHHLCIFAQFCRDAPASQHIVVKAVELSISSISEFFYYINMKSNPNTVEVTTCNQNVLIHTQRLYKWVNGLKDWNGGEITILSRRVWLYFFCRLQFSGFFLHRVLACLVSSVVCIFVQTMIPCLRSCIDFLRAILLIVYVFR